MRRMLRRSLVALGGSVMLALLLAGPAIAQVTIDPTETAATDDGGWVYWMAEGAIILGVLILILAGVAYLRFAPRFQREEEDAAPRAGRRAPEPAVSLQTSWQQASAVAVQAVPAPQPVAVAAPAAAPAPAQRAPAPAAATPAAPAAASAAASPAPEAAPAAEAAAAPAAPAPAAPRPKGEPVELDQETLDRVVAEELAKGTDRRVAEGRARSAAFKAARAKSGG